MNKIFDPLWHQNSVNIDSYRRITNTAKERLTAPFDPAERYAPTLCLPTHFYVNHDAVYGYISGANIRKIHELLDLARQMAEMSLARSEWNLHTPRPDFYVGAHLTKIEVNWFQTGTLDRDSIAKLFSENLGGFHPLQGVTYLMHLAPLSAWDALLLGEQYPLWHHPDEKIKDIRKPDYDERFAMQLAAEPGQLHDPKSPMRKKIRGRMLRNMAGAWLGQGSPDTASYWLRTVEWREGESGLSPREVMLRAYAYMPDIEPPPNIRTEVEQLKKIPI